MNEFLAGRELMRDILGRITRITEDTSRITDKLDSISIKQCRPSEDHIPASAAPRLETLAPDILPAVTGHLDSVRNICRLMQVITPALSKYSRLPQQ